MITAGTGRIPQPGPTWLWRSLAWAVKLYRTKHCLKRLPTLKQHCLKRLAPLKQHRLPFEKASSTETTLFVKASSTKTSKIFISYICCQNYQNNEHKHGYVPHHSISSTLASECGHFLEHISNTLAAECGRFLEQDCAIFRAGCLASPVAPPPHQQGCPSCPPSSPVRWTGSSCMS